MVVGVSLDEPEKKGGLKAMKEFVAEQGYRWPQYYQGNGWQSDFSTGWGIMSIPTVFLIDRKGNLRETDVGNLEESIKKLLVELAYKLGVLSFFLVDRAALCNSRRGREVSPA